MKDKSCENCKWGAFPEDESICCEEGAEDCSYETGLQLWEPIDLSYHKIAEEIAGLVVVKQKAYGNSFGCAAEFLKLLYPKGVPIEKYDDMLTLVRIFDKIKRIATDKDALGESPYQDILGYCLLAIKNKEKGGD